jgi:hypothetical protein
MDMLRPDIDGMFLLALIRAEQFVRFKVIARHHGVDKKGTSNDLCSRLRAARQQTFRDCGEQFCTPFTR